MAETISMPKLGFDMAEGTLVRWLKKEGETIAKGDVLAEIETDKATVEVESTASGTIRKLLVEMGSVVPVNTPIAIVGDVNEPIDVPIGNSGIATGEMKEDPKKPVPILSPVIAQESTSSAQKASPLAKKIARDRKVDLTAVKGTGPGGRVVKRDIEAHLSGGKNLPVHAPTMEPGKDEILLMTRLRQAIARRMTESKQTLPHFYVTHEYRMDALMGLRTQYNQIVPENEKLSVNDFIVRAVALALRQYPNLNSTLDGNSILRHGQVNVGIAVSVEGGLLTIVCKNADTKSLGEIGIEIRGMASRARDGKVKPEDIEGSTFSISNLGMYDVENFIAIINPPEAAILAVGSAREVPVVENGTLKTGLRMKATLSVDHRVSDGVEAARFLQALALYLEEPLRLIL